MVAEQHKRPILIWLYTGAFLVFSMVIIGGLTRLTNSGLSMVEWKLIMGSVPPLSESDWQETFAKYQDFPEYQQINSEFSLEEFKSIFWWEYIHRMLGRFIGIVFMVPFIIFLIRKWLDPPLTKQLLLMLFLGAFQGFLGWFMVASGLVDIPHVSHYRLAAHLITATVLLMYILWVAFTLNSEKAANVPVKVQKLTRFLIGLILVQILYGAFVAGLKAGYVFNTFPKMGSSWFPIAITSLQPLWSNFTEGLAGVQFVHRYLAYLVIVTVVWLWAVAAKEDLNTEQQRGMKLVVGMVLLQFALGVATLIMSVPVSIAVLHQACAIILLSSVVYFLSRLTYQS